MLGRLAGRLAYIHKVNVAIFLDAINVINVKLCIMVLLTALSADRQVKGPAYPKL